MFIRHLLIYIYILKCSFLNMFKNQKSVCGSPGGDLFPLIFRGAGIEVVQQIHEHPQKPHQSHSAIGLRG